VRDLLNVNVLLSDITGVKISLRLHIAAYCCNLAVALNARFTTNGMCAKNSTHI